MALLFPTLAVSALLALVGWLEAGALANRSKLSAVEQIYPTSEVLPENLLRFYIYFSTPMSEEGILDSIELLDADGAEIEGVFLENRYNLWSADRRRLTLLLNPARVKTGLAAHMSLGRALEVGKTYSLVVKKSARSRSNQPLAEDFVKQFKVSEMRRTPPQLERWEVISPSTAQQGSLSLKLDAVYDHHSLAHRIRVIDSDGELVKGRIELGSNESEWRFWPSSSWSKGHYRIKVDSRLEDIAGNRPSELFDRPPGQSKKQTAHQYITFSVEDDIENRSNSKRHK